MNIEDIQDSVRVGVKVSVLLRTGHQFSGVLSEIRGTKIILRQSSGTKMSLFAEEIDCIFPIQTTDSSIETRPSLQSSDTSTLLPTHPSISSNPQNNEVIIKIVEIEDRFSTAIQQVKLEPFNLSVIVIKSNKAKACYALYEYFKISSPSENLVAWYKFIDLALKSGVINQLSNIFDKTVEDNRENDSRLIIESAIFALKKHNKDKEAQELASSLIKSNPELARLSQVLKLMLSNLGVEATETYLKREQELKQAQEEIKRYDNKIKQQKEVESLISSAQNFAKRQQYAQAIPKIRKALEKEPENTLAQKLLNEYCEAGKERALPTGSGDYAKAKRAEIQDKDLKKAEKLYRQAIKNNDNSETAVKDLASLLTRQNKDEEAIKILKEYCSKASNQQPILNSLATAYQRVGKYQDEIEALQDVFNFTSYDKGSTVLKRIALAQFRLGEYQKAKQTLEQAVKQNPRDETVLNLLAALREGEKTGVYTKLDALFLTQEGMGDIQTTLSSFLAFHVHQCDYSGIEASKITSKKFNEKDVEKLQQRAGEILGTQRPRERASYYLSAAKILIDLGSKAEELLPRKYLRNFCAAMGDACITEQKHPDVARSYYAEAFLIAPDWVKQLEIKLSQYIMLYYSQTEELLKTEIPSVESCLERALKITNKDLGTSVIEGLLYLSWLNREVGRFLINKINPNKRLRELVQNLCYQTCGEKGKPTGDDSVFLELWERGRELIRRRNQEVLDEFAFLNSIVISLDSVREQIEKVQLLGQKVRGALDKNRLKTIQEILNYMYVYSQQQSYMEREYFKAIIQNRVSEVIEDIEKNPTKYSW